LESKGLDDVTEMIETLIRSDQIWRVGPWLPWSPLCVGYSCILLHLQNSWTHAVQPNRSLEVSLLFQLRNSIRKD